MLVFANPPSTGKPWLALPAAPAGICDMRDRSGIPTLRELAALDNERMTAEQTRFFDEKMVESETRLKEAKQALLTFQQVWRSTRKLVRSRAMSIAWCNRH